MATKWKNFSRHPAVKTVSFLLFCVCAALIVWQGLQLDQDERTNGYSMDDHVVGTPYGGRWTLAHDAEDILNLILNDAGWRSDSGNSVTIDSAAARYYVKTPHGSYTNNRMSWDEYKDYPVYMLWRKGNYEISMTRCL